ncbi:MAG: flagellin lysine-N-methylase [Lachnospiraceae bacterium]|nr:flagellin lysine-N-methylase [Lachnospiraceae bacterium]
MILRYPSYYEDFHCIAGACEDTCCAGWEIDIDDESYQYYQSVDGVFGQRLRENIQEYEEENEGAYERHGFILKEKGRCPFLDEENLCELYQELGEEALCDVCTDTPRNYLEYGGAREVAVSASCPEAGRLIYRSSEKTTFVEKEIEEELDFEESREEKNLARAICQARDEALRILQNRELSLYRRILLFLAYGEEVQECLNTNAPEKIEKLRPEDYCRRLKQRHRMSEMTCAEGLYEMFLHRMRSFSEMVSIREDWEEMLCLLQEYFVTPEKGAQEYHKALKEWQTFMEKEEREYEYEHLLVYYAFMCLPRCVDDFDFLRQVKFTVVSFLMLRDMDVVWFEKQGHRYTKEDRVRMARIYAKEVEHSQENMDFLMEEILFEEAYTTDSLHGSVGKVE